MLQRKIKFLLSKNMVPLDKELQLVNVKPDRFWHIQA